MKKMLDQTLRDLGYVSSKADPDVWIKAETKPYGTEYYAYFLLYDELHLHHDPDTFMNLLAEVYRLNDDSVGEPADIPVQILERYNWMTVR